MISAVHTVTVLCIGPLDAGKVLSARERRRTSDPPVNQTDGASDEGSDSSSLKPCDHDEDKLKPQSTLREKPEPHTGNCCNLQANLQLEAGCSVQLLSTRSSLPELHFHSFRHSRL